MRQLNTRQHPDYVITVFAWNGKYLLKFEQGLMEQTYKIRETDLNGDADIDALLKNEEFLKEVSAHFEAMRQSLYKAADAL
ncbi:MAG: hypothetical protein V4543_15325 [Bacteroidota bacterium]